jgi:methylenetetrahydrofolate dehydrogenase (NADP+) / methenyltetrahydrofolate cyclohydrolase
MRLIDGKKTAQDIRNEIKEEVAKMIDDGSRPPHLAAVIVGEDPASQTYVRSKEKQAKEVGFTSSIYELSSDISEKELLQTVKFLNNDKNLDGYIVQLPLPKHVNENKVVESIDPTKDVDGFHPTNVGRLCLGLPTFISATPNGIMELLKRYNIETEGKHCVVLGRSHIVGSPISILMSQKNKNANATVTLCHSKTEKLKEICLQADIIIAAIGQKEFLKADMVKKDAVIIDVGMHRIPSSKTKSGFRLVGDVDFENVSKKTSFITPVPGGVGPMTIASLLQNTLKARKLK